MTPRQAGYKSGLVRRLPRVTVYRIRYWRKRGLSYEKIADKLCENRSTVFHYCNEDRNHYLRTYNRVYSRRQDRT